MTFIDTHCHLDYLDDIEGALERANSNGVDRLIIPTTDSQSALKVLDLVANHKRLFVALGIYPLDVKTEHTWEDGLEEEIAQIDQLLSHHYPRVVAIGECGLDFNRDENAKQQDVQIRLLKQHLSWAKKYNLPIQIHNRKASQVLLALLQDYQNQVTGVFHCFTGSKAFLRQVLSLGFYIGIGGLITTDTGLQEVIKEAPLDKIILETDTPYLTPKPVKELNPWPNEPANLVYSARKLADLKSVPLEKIAEITTINASKLFPLPR